MHVCTNLPTVCINYVMYACFKYNCYFLYDNYIQDFQMWPIFFFEILYKLKEQSIFQILLISVIETGYDSIHCTHIINWDQHVSKILLLIQKREEKTQMTCQFSKVYWQDNQSFPNNKSASTNFIWLKTEHLCSLDIKSDKLRP